MNRTRFQRLRQAAEAALELTGEAREASLRRALRDDPELLAEARALLAAEASSDGFLEDPAIESPPSPAESTWEGKTLGRYRLVRKLGEGGMGAVYLAERSDGEFAKPVAIKVAYRAAWDDELRWRVRRERQILARLEHPHIARLYDGGTWQGVPYFAMEFVDGLPIDDYSQRHQLSLEQRLALFLEVCDAVGFAHRALVVHRDLKPANILVTHRGEPKLLDFGIAKALTADTTEPPTQLGQRPLTPSYASPEQLQGEPVSTASDLYSLGVLLYRLITGELPRRITAFDPAGLDRAFAAEPPAPSRLAAEATAAGPRRSSRDLDAIVTRAIAADPQRRYPTTEHLAADLRAFLAGRPVSARPARLAYRVGLYIRRHRLRTAAAALLLLTAIASLCQSTMQATEIARQRDRALVESRRANETVSFLVDILENTDPSRTGGGGPETLAFATRQIRQRLRDHPLQRADLLATVGRLQLRLGRPDLAADLLTEARDLYRETASPREPQTDGWLASALAERGDYRRAEELYRNALADPRLAPRERARNLSGLGVTHLYAGNLEAATLPLERALNLLARDSQAAELRALTLNRLGLVASLRDGAPAAEPFHRQALAAQQQALGGDHPALAQTLIFLARVQEDRGARREAGESLQQALKLRREAYGEHSPLLGETLLEYSRWLHAEGDLTTSRETLEQGCSILTVARGPQHRDTAACLLGLGQIELALDNLDRAEELLDRSLRRLRTTHPDHHSQALPLRQLAVVAAKRGDFATARQRLEAGLRLAAGALPEEVTFVAEMQHDLGRVLAELGETEQARQWLSTAIQNLEHRLGPEAPRVREARARLATLPSAGAATPTTASISP
ncbi:MAG: tetratricopeptide repeat protein [Acidobacteriota bacterium]